MLKRELSGGVRHGAIRARVWKCLCWRERERERAFGVAGGYRRRRLERLMLERELSEGIEARGYKSRGL